MIAQALGMRINNPGHTHIIYISMVLLILQQETNKIFVFQVINILKYSSIFLNVFIDFSELCCSGGNTVT